MKGEFSCMYFLAKMDFDFKKSFYNGLDFMRLQNLPEYSQALKECSLDKSISHFIEKMDENIETQIFKK